MIRFNPDDYLDELGKKVKSSWTLGKDGILRPCKKDWNNRLTVLKETIFSLSTFSVPDLVNIIHLFYDSQ